MLKISKIKSLNTLVIGQDTSREFFIASPTTIVIGVDFLAVLIKFLVDKEYISYKILDGILEEYHSNLGGTNGTVL